MCGLDSEKMKRKSASVKFQEGELGMGNDGSVKIGKGKKERSLKLSGHTIENVQLYENEERRIQIAGKMHA